MNRHGDQAYLEKAIRDAGGCTDFLVIITYPNTETQIPSHYSYTYTIKGKVVHDEFDNVNPDEYNAKLESNKTTSNTNNNDSKGNNTTSDSNTNNTKNENKNTDNNAETVYWTPNGKSYHTTKSCSTLSRSKVINSGTQAQSGKYDPCDRCH